MRMLRVSLWLGVLLLTFCIMTGCSGMTEGVAEREIVKRAPEFIGPAVSYRADIEGLKKNRVRQVAIVGIGVQPEPGLCLDYLSITLSDVCFTMSPFAVTSIGNTQFVAQINETALNSYLQQTGRASIPNIKDIHITLQQDRVSVKANATIAGVEVPVVIAGPVVVQDETKIILRPEVVTVAGINAPGAIRELVEKNVNPVADLSTLSIQPRLSTLTVTPGRLTLAGSAQVPTNLGQPIAGGSAASGGAPVCPVPR